MCTSSARSPSLSLTSTPWWKTISGESICLGHWLSRVKLQCYMVIGHGHYRTCLYYMKHMHRRLPHLRLVDLRHCTFAQWWTFCRNKSAFWFLQKSPLKFARKIERSLTLLASLLLPLSCYHWRWHCGVPFWLVIKMSSSIRLIIFPATRSSSTPYYACISKKLYGNNAAIYRTIDTGRPHCNKSYSKWSSPLENCSFWNGKSSLLVPEPFVPRP